MKRQTEAWTLNNQITDTRWQISDFSGQLSAWGNFSEFMGERRFTPIKCIAPMGLVALGETVPGAYSPRLFYSVPPGLLIDFPARMGQKPAMLELRI